MNFRRGRVNRGHISINPPYFCGDLLNSILLNRVMIPARIYFAPQRYEKAEHALPDMPTRSAPCTQDRVGRTSH